MNISLQFLNTWMNNFKKNIINDHILLLVFRGFNHRNKTIDMQWIEEVLFANMNKEYYQLSNVDELNNINELQNHKGKKNLIVFGYSGINIDKIANTNFEILLYFNPLKYITKFKTLNNLLAFNNIKNPYIRLDIIKKKDPLEIITSKCIVKINNFIKVLFFPDINDQNYLLFQSINILKSNGNTSFYLNYLSTLENDILLLVRQRKLTARLAIAIYKVSTLRFYDNNTKIGTFFRKKLGCRSKTYKLPYKAYPQIVKIYDLDSI